MKKTIIFAVIATALALVSCHQPTKEEQQVKNVEKVVDNHVKANFEYPKGYEITDIRIDTATTNHRCAEMLQTWVSDSVTEDNAIQHLMFYGLSEKRRNQMKMYATRDIFDLTQEDVAYVCAKVTVRHRSDREGNKRVSLIYIFMRNDEVVEIVTSDTHKKFQDVLDKWQPTEVQNVIEAMSEMADTWSFLN